jgi:hypothetical protein
MSSDYENKRPPPTKPLTPNADLADAAVSDQERKFFLAAFQGGLREARVYRAYPDKDAILFL